MNLRGGGGEESLARGATLFLNRSCTKGNISYSYIAACFNFYFALGDYKMTYWGMKVFSLKFDTNESNLRCKPLMFSGFISPI